MLDRSIPSLNIIMEKFDPENYPKVSLPEGYEFSFDKAGDEREWARIECELGQFDTLEKALALFEREFFKDQRLKPEERMLFVKSPDGEIIATATLWDGFVFGRLEQRIHWVATSDKCAGLGIAKALLSRLMELYGALGYKDYIYLWTGTRSYPAVSIYRKFGFKEYRGEINPISNEREADYPEQNERAIAIADEYIKKYKKP